MEWNSDTPIADFVNLLPDLEDDEREEIVQILSEQAFKRVGRLQRSDAWKGMLKAFYVDAISAALYPRPMGHSAAMGLHSSIAIDVPLHDHRGDTKEVGGMPDEQDMGDLEADVFGDDDAHAQARVKLSAVTGFEVRNVTVRLRTQLLPCLPASAPKTVLRDVSCSFRPGTMVALMGASGAGKTTFLHTISQRMKPSSNTLIAGSVLLNGEHEVPLSKLSFSATGSLIQDVSCFVPQDDIMLGQLTPRELIKVAADLRLSTTSDASRQQVVDSILSALDINKCADSQAGGYMIRGISGGERKRASVAMELVSSPLVIFVDEPTTGLDSVSAFKVMKCLKQLAAAGRIVICSIHQPSTEIWELFDTLVLLTKGRLVYSGAAALAPQHFEAMGFQRPTFCNPADFVVDVLENNRDAASIDRLAAQYESVKDILNAAPAPSPTVHGLGLEEPATASLGAPPAAGMERSNSTIAALSTKDLAAVAARAPVDAAARAGWFGELGVLLKRGWQTYSRTKLLAQTKVIQVVFIGLLLGLTFMDLPKNQASIQNRLGCIYFTIVSQVFVNVLNVVLTFTEERAVFLREQGNRLYGVTSYFLAKSLVDLPVESLMTFLFSLTCYWFFGFGRTGEQFMTFFVVLLLLGFAGQSIGLIVAAAVPSQFLAAVLAPFSFAPFILFTPYAVPASRVPIYMIPFKLLSPFWWSFSALSVNELDGLQFTCDEGEHRAGGACQFETGVAVLDHYDIPRGMIARDCGMLIALIFIFRALAGLTFYLLSRKAVFGNAFVDVSRLLHKCKLCCCSSRKVQKARA